MRDLNKQFDQFQSYLGRAYCNYGLERNKSSLIRQYLTYILTIPLLGFHIQPLLKLKIRLDLLDALVHDNNSNIVETREKTFQK